MNRLFCLKWDPYERQERRENGGLQGRTSPYPLSRSVPPSPGLGLMKVDPWMHIPIFQEM